MATDAKPSLGEQVRRLFDIFVPVESMLMTARAVGVFMLVLGTVFGGGLVSAQAYRDAIPGGIAYKVKIGIERTQLALAPNDDYRTRLHADFADRRMDEVAQLAEGNAASQAYVPRTLAAFRTEVAALGSGLESLRQSDPANVLDAAKLMERKMAVYQNQLRKASALLSPSLLPSVAYTRDSLDGVTLKAMAVIVEHHRAGDDQASRAMVVNKLEEHIQAAETQLDADSVPATKATQAKAALAAAKQAVKDQNYEAALLKITEVAELTKEAPPADESADPAAPADQSNQGATSNNTTDGTVTPPADPAPAASQGAPASGPGVTSNTPAASQTK